MYLMGALIFTEDNVAIKIPGLLIVFYIFLEGFFKFLVDGF